jgi:prepilin-type N-terminal cleavage/methylation domain-containing protein
MTRRYLSGFTLIEIAVVLFIFGLLIAGLLGPLETQLEARDRAATIKTMDEIIESLYGYAITNGRLPCPDTDGDGLPNPVFNPANSATATCTGEGAIPWIELNAPQGDAWGNRFRYRIRSPHFAMPESDGVCNGDTATVPEFDLCTSGDIIVTTRGYNPATTPAVEGKASLNLAQGLPAVIISHGRNGFGATNINGVARPAPPATNLDELENADGDITFLTRIFTGENGGCSDDTDEANPLCEYDDIVRWISPALLNNRMVVAGQLP